MTLLRSAFGLGLAVCASPGIITVQAVQRGLDRGFYAALFVQVGALLDVALWSGIGLLSSALLTDHVFARIMLNTVGLMLLLWLISMALRDAVWHQPREVRSASVGRDFAVGAAVPLANPLLLAFWIGVR